MVTPGGQRVTGLARLPASVIWNLLQVLRHPRLAKWNLMHLSACAKINIDRYHGFVKSRRTRRSTHQVADGMHSALIGATKPEAWEEPVTNRLRRTPGSTR